MLETTHTHTDTHKHTETTPQKPALLAGGMMTEGNKSLPSYVIIVQMIISSWGGGVVAANRIASRFKCQMWESQESKYTLTDKESSI